MTDLAALKVKIGTKPGGSADYPDFNSLSSVDGDWSTWIDVNGPGWLYDKVTGHKDVASESPFGQQWGVILAPVAFVDEAVAAFPDQCQRLSEAQLSSFYTSQIEPIEADVLRNEPALAALAAEKQLRPDDVDLDARIAKALDPTDGTPGVRENPRLNWTKFKASRGITVV